MVESTCVTHCHVFRTANVALNVLSQQKAVSNGELRGATECSSHTRKQVERGTL